MQTLLILFLTRLFFFAHILIINRPSGIGVYRLSGFDSSFENQLLSNQFKFKVMRVFLQTTAKDSSTRLPFFRVSCLKKVCQRTLLSLAYQNIEQEIYSLSPVISVEDLNQPGGEVTKTSESSPIAKVPD